ncbi:MAG: PaREP1 family protein [Sulfolobaceae archaeon]
MTIRDEITYARISYNDFIVSYYRLEKGDLRLSAFRAYKAERRLLQSLAMRHNLHRKDIRCAVPKKEMLQVSKQLDKIYRNIYQFTEMALSLFEQYKENKVDKKSIILLLVSLNYEWVSQYLTKEQVDRIKMIKCRMMKGLK